MQQATLAYALDFKWSFVDRVSGEKITGTISGLVEGNNSGSGLTITVQSIPTGKLYLSNWIFDGISNNLVVPVNSTSAFVVTRGQVTGANAKYYDNAGDQLILIKSTSPGRSNPDSYGELRVNNPKIFFDGFSIVFQSVFDYKLIITGGAVLGVPLFIVLYILKKRLARKGVG